MKVKINKKYRHFKGMEVQVIAIAKHSETLEDMVVYQELDNDSIWVRPYELFISKVDHEKYPDIKQEYRFEKID